MREIRPSGSEGGRRKSMRRPYLYRIVAARILPWSSSQEICPEGGEAFTPGSG